MSKNLTKEEAKLAEAAYQEFEDEYLHLEAMNNEPADIN